MRTGLALLPMVAIMMVMSPVTGGLVNKVGPKALISLGMTITGIGTGLLLLTGTDASYWAILPSFLVMGFGMSGIWAPMTTAVLNSVESEKSGVASAVNGALREIGTAFGVALLGTVANRAYQSEFRDSAEIQSLRAGGDSGLNGVLDHISTGMSMGGHVIRDTELFDPAKITSLTPSVVDTIQNASAKAFIYGQDRAVIFATVGMIAAAILSYFLIDEAVVSKPAEEPQAAPIVDAEPVKI
jgi:MFS family permease